MAEQQPSKLKNARLAASHIVTKITGCPYFLALSLHMASHIG
jgi:hypothetical protein